MLKEELNKTNIKVGGHYNWRQQEERIVYSGKYGAWHQFSLVGIPKAGVRSLTTSECWRKPMKIKSNTIEGVLIRAANRYASARADLSWQGAQDPADRGALRLKVTQAKSKLERLCFAVAEALKQKESNRAN